MAGNPVSEALRVAGEAGHEHLAGEADKEGRKERSETDEPFLQEVASMLPGMLGSSLDDTQAAARTAASEPGHNTGRDEPVRNEDGLSSEDADGPLILMYLSSGGALWAFVNYLAFPILMWISWGCMDHLLTPWLAFLRFVPAFCRGGIYLVAMISMTSTENFLAPPESLPLPSMLHIVQGTLGASVLCALILWVPVYPGMFIEGNIICMIALQYSTWRCRQHGAEEQHMQFATDLQNQGTMLSLVLMAGLAFSYPYFQQILPSLAGACFSLGIVLLEVLGVKMIVACCQRATPKVQTRGIPWIPVHVASLNACGQSMHTVAMVTAILYDPASILSCLQSLSTSLLLGVCGRSGWTSFFLHKVTKRPMFLPTAVKLCQDEMKIMSSYAKLSIPLSILLARCALDVQPFYFSLNYQLVLLAMFAAMVIEDTCVWAMRHLSLCPAWGLEAREHYENCTIKNQIKKAYRWDSANQQHANIEWQSLTTSQAAVMYITSWSGPVGYGIHSMIGSISASFILGRADEPTPRVDDGLFLWHTDLLKCC